MAEQAAAKPAFPLSPGAFARLNARQKLAAIAAIALAVALLVGVWLWAKEPPYSLLFSNLTDQDGGRIVASLQQQKIPYKYSEVGGAILVPADMVHDVRLRLASEGLPQGGLVGFELMERQKLGISQFAEQVNYQRGLEGELARSIQTLASVRAARVHLAIPKQTAFLRDEQKPSASVLVSLQPGRRLDAPQIAGIVHLVSSSVPRLGPDRISVIDQDGNLLSEQRDPLRNAGLDTGQLGYLKAIEAQYVRRVEAILEPLLGRNNFRAQVAAEVDFSQVEQVDESWLPNPAPETAIRSQQFAETGSGVPPAFGIPGALSNQPPVPATAPLTAPQVGERGGEAGANVGNFSRSATINYELDKTVRHTRAAPGTVKRLSVAVVVNHKPGPVKDGVAGKPIQLTAEEIQRIDSLVREAVGFNATRGDSIKVAAAGFVAPEPEIIAELPVWQAPANVALAKEVARYAILILIAFLIWTRILKPVFAMLAAAAEHARAEEKAAAELARAEAVGGVRRGPSFDERIKGAREVTQREPKVVAEMVKEWMGGGGS